VRSSRRRWQFNPKRLALYAAAALFGFGLGLVCLVYAPRAYRTWRESRLMKAASAALAQGNYRAASDSARAALQIRPNSLSAFQVLAEATEKENRAETVTWRAQIARLSPHRLDSQLNLASAALRFNQLDVARRALENVAPQERDAAAYHVVAGWLARAEGNERDVEQHFAAAVHKEPGNDLYQFNLAVLQIRSPDPEKYGAARATLERLSKIAAYRAGALRALLSDAVQRNDLGRADSLAQDLQMSQQVTFADYLLCLDFYRKLDQKKLAAVVERVKPVAARNPVDLALLIDWMNKNGLAAEALRWSEKLPPALTTSPPPAVAIADSFVEVKNWSRLKRWTRGASWGDSEYLRYAYQAYAARQTRQSAADAEFDSLWHSADHAASEKPEHEVALARLATKWNLSAESEQLWLRVSRYSPPRREALDALLHIYRARNDLPNLYHILQRIHESSPNEIWVAADYARLSLLLDQNTPDAHRLARETYERAPNDLDAAVTYAFSLYNLGRTAEGLQVIGKLPPEMLRDPHAAVFVSLLLIDENRTEAARDYIAIAQNGPLFPEEKKLLEEALVKSAAAATPVPGASPSLSPGASPTPANSPAGSASPPPPPPAPGSPGQAQRSPFAIY
jgi:Tfp pilus assembly protein PilF